MSPQKFHLGPSGPAPCGADERACPYGEADHGTEAELQERWQQKLQNEHSSFLSGATRSYAQGSIEELLTVLNREVLLGEHEDYPVYRDEELSVVQKLIPVSRSGISFARTVGQDEEWSSDGSTDVERHYLRDGSKAYFKGLHQDVDVAGDSDAYGFTSLGMLTNEVNAYRISLVLGEGFEGLVPETSFRTISGKFGVLQREVYEPEASEGITDGELIQDDYRKAAIFDFVIGNVDRHGGNFLLGVDSQEAKDSPRRLRLIDHGMSFYDDQHRQHIYPISIFSDNFTVDMDLADENSGYEIPEDELELTEGERQSLRRARSTVKAWIEKGTIDRAAGSAVDRRISTLLVHDRIVSFSSHLKGIREEAEYQQRKTN